MARVRLDVNGFFDHMIGAHGLAREDVEGLAPRVASVVRTIEAAREQGELPFHGLPYDAELRASVNEQARGVRDRFERCVVLGIGGSALGTRAVLAGLPPRARSGGIEVEVLDNIDPSTLNALLRRIDPATTLFNVISKSGTTAETMAQLLIVREAVADRVGGASIGEHFLFTTDARSGLLRALAEAGGVATLPVPEGVGGRFSVLSAVGLFPLAVAGVDIEGLHAGARQADSVCRPAEVWHNPAALHAALLFLALKERGAAMHVFMAYKDGLAALAEWYAQLWAESLGKRLSRGGDVVETGQTPVRAIGATDQHSQVQLYVEGPRDKVVTFARVEAHEDDVEIPAGFPDRDELAYLPGRGLGELLNIEQRATELALVRAGRPTSVIEIDRLDAHAFGYLFHLFEVQTLIMGGLLDIDPLDQPGVEEGKILTRAMAGGAGLEREAQAVRDWVERKRRDLVLG